MANELSLRYGINPHQRFARVFNPAGRLPFRVLNGQPGYINLLDALNAWQLVQELSQALSLPAAASFKHVSPSGAAVGRPMSDAVAQASFVADMELSPLATAYARARGADRLSSFGDWAALSHPVDRPTARLLHREVSDGIIAPGYEPDALEILRQKKSGRYPVLEIDPDYKPPYLEKRDVFGLSLEQARNQAVVQPEELTNIATHDHHLAANALADLALALITVKYTQSNSVCLAYDGQVVGVGAGQQSRIQCTRLAADKADLWQLRQHPTVLQLKFRPDISRAERDNAVDRFLRAQNGEDQLAGWQEGFAEVPRPLAMVEQREWLSQFGRLALASDAFFPFRDSIDRAAQSGVAYVAQPGGSMRDEDVIEACNQHGMVMVMTGTRLFHH